MSGPGGGAPPPQRGGLRELRLAVVCYGGVSLAIYMHGITKEILKLVAASAALAERPDTNPFRWGTERVYWDLLDRISRGEAGKRSKSSTIRVVVDIISGTSAGGINGVFLAKALATNRSQDPLRELWLDHGDVSVLLRGSPRIPAQLRAAWIALEAAFRPLRVEAPLRGDDMCRILHTALQQMDHARVVTPHGSLLPPGVDLQLFVPITDFHGYAREIPLYDPRFLRDRTHRHVMQFRRRRSQNQFTSEFNHPLAFAARATSSFPGAFPPVSFDDYERCFEDEVRLADTAPTFFPLYSGTGFQPATTHFIDGGVLDNFPFGSAIQAVAAKPAETEVDRRLIYIEPDPTEGVLASDEAASPGVYRTVFGGYAGIPRKEPILDDLIRLADRNDAVLRVRDVIESSFDTIRTRVAELLDEVEADHLLSEEASAEELVALRRKVELRAIGEVGFGTGTYLRLRVRSLVDGYASAACSVLGFPSSSFKASFVTSALRHWAVGVGLLEQDPDEAQQANQATMLSQFDLQYLERRTRFLIAAVSWLYPRAGHTGVPPRPELDKAKDALYRQLSALYGIVDDLAADAELAAGLGKVFNDDAMSATAVGDELKMARFVNDRRGDLDALSLHLQADLAERLPALEVGLHCDLLAFLDQLGDDLRRDLLTRYLGFPFWDLLVFPIQAMSGVGERDHIEVYRMSPQDARLLDAEGDEPLKGMSLYHFGAFLSRPGREGDYLWGRLDAVERLVKLLLDVRPEPSSLAEGAAAAAPPDEDPDELARECVPAFRAVLDEEDSQLPNVQDLLATLSRRVAALESRTGG